MNENRIKLVKLLSVANAVFLADGLVSDEEIDRVFGTRFSDLMKEAKEGGDFSEEATFGQLVDKLLEEWDF